MADAPRVCGTIIRPWRPPVNPLGAQLRHAVPSAFDGADGTYDLGITAITGTSRSTADLEFGVGFSTVYGQTGLSPIVTQTSPNDTRQDNRFTAGKPLWFRLRDQITANALQRLGG